MHRTFAIIGAATLLATPLNAAPGDFQRSANTAAAKTGEMAAKPRPQAGAMAKPQVTTAKTNYQAGQKANQARPMPATGTNSNNYNANRPVNTGRPVNANNKVVTGNTVVVPGNNRTPANNRYPVYTTPNGNYYRPPNGGYYRPPPPPVGGWGGGYYPPPRYQYDDGPSVGAVIAGVAVTGTLLYVLTQATKPKQQTVVVQGGPPPMPPPPQTYVPPANSTGAPAKIAVDFAGLAPEARPSASVCIAEASRQIGATGGTEIRIDRIVDVEPGNGGYRFRVNLLGIYPDETRMIPMYCRATPEKIIELTFG